jgi:hypothetical protein
MDPISYFLCLGGRKKGEEYQKRYPNDMARKKGTKKRY